MEQQLNSALKNYHQNWQSVTPNNVQSLQTLKPTAVGWKVADQLEYQQKYTELRPLCDKIVETWMNGRWIAKMHLKDIKLAGDIEIVKLMQCRPGSDDALGLDHVDFTCPNVKQIEAQLQQSDLKWSWETNDIIANYDWISVWFAGTEAKIKQGSVLDTVIQELQEINQRITQ